MSAAEGKSTLAANTAISLASRGVSVLFIDLDLRRPVQSEMLGLPVKQKNELGTLLSESAAPEKILSAAGTDPSTGLHSQLSTKAYTDVSERLASVQLARVVALAREQYDYVIIDSPPLGFFSDSELLSDLSDASVLVVRQDTLPEDYQVDCVAEDGAVMGLSHRTLPLFGVQFHPEAVLTEYGHELLENFCRMAEMGGVRA